MMVNIESNHRALKTFLAKDTLKIDQEIFIIDLHMIKDLKRKIYWKGFLRK